MFVNIYYSMPIHLSLVHTNVRIAQSVHKLAPVPGRYSNEVANSKMSPKRQKADPLEEDEEGREGYEPAATTQ